MSAQSRVESCLGNSSLKPSTFGRLLYSQPSVRMKVLLLLFPLVLGNPIQEQLDVGSPEDRALLQQMVQDLFSERNGREIDVDDEEAAEVSDLSTNLASSEPVDEKLTAGSLVQESDPIEIARFNNYMDAIYRRMNAALRAKLMDPMILNLDAKKKGNNEKKGKREGRDEDHEVSKRSADLQEDIEVSEVDRIGEVEAEAEDEEDVEEGEGRKLAKRGNNKGKKKGGKKKKSKLTEEEKKKKKEERMKHKKSKGKKKHGNKKGKKHNKGKKEDAEKKGHKGKKEGRKDKHEKHEDNAGALTRSRRNKHSKNDKSKGKKSHKKSNDLEDVGKSMGSLSGIATLRRSNDVVVMNSDNYKVVKSDFSIGPLQLEVSKTFGKGKSRSVKTAKAVTEELAGKMVLKVKPDGSAHVKSVFFHKPEKVEVRGSLGSKKRRSDTYLKNSVGKVRPMAAQRILKMARYVLKSPSTVERS